MKTFKMRHMAWIIALVLLAALCVFPAGAQSSCAHGEGYENGFCIACDAAQPAVYNSEKGWYEISNAGQLYWFADLARAKDADTVLNAKLMGNITVNTELGTEPDRDLARPWEPIGTAAKAAENINFDGQGYAIHGLYGKYADDRDVGLFGVAKNVTVQNLGLVYARFEANTGFVGGIVANAKGGVTVTRCYVFGIMDSEYGSYAWIVGAMDKDENGPCTVSYCYTTGEKVVAPGAHAESVVENCYYQYPFSSEADNYVGTTRFNDELLLPDGETTLISALSTQEHPWVKNCRTGMPALIRDHVYEYPCTPECKVCGDTNRTNKAEHTFSYECDNTCDVCNRIIVTRTEEHVAYTTCGTVCRYCGTTIPAKTAHQYSTACDATCDCGFERDEVPHVYDDACDTRCNICGTVRTAVPHTYDNDCDRVCNACGVTRPPQHTYDNPCDEECNVCQEKRVTEHQYGEFSVAKDATRLKNGERERICALCGHRDIEEIERLGVELWMIVVCGVVAAVILSVGGFALYWFVIKKRSFAELLGKEPAKKTKKEKKKK